MHITHTKHSFTLKFAHETKISFPTNSMRSVNAVCGTDTHTTHILFLGKWLLCGKKHITPYTHSSPHGNFCVANAHGFTANICPNSICTWFLVLLYRNSRFKTNAPHIYQHQHPKAVNSNSSNSHFSKKRPPDYNYDFCISNQPCYIFFALPPFDLSLSFTSNKHIHA